jgi:predicted MFS family arabinose efflux permease
VETSNAGGDGFTLPYATLLGLGALDAAGYSMIGPVAPQIAAQTHASTLMIGALVASFPFGIALGFVLAGFGITHRRDRQVLLISLLAVAIGAAAFVVSSDLATLFAGRLVMGVGSGGVWMAVTFSTLERWPGQEYLCMGRIFAAYSVGGPVGPAIGGVGGIRTPFALYLALTLIAMVPAATMAAPQRRRTFHADRSALRLPGFWAASAGILFAVLTLASSMASSRSTLPSS